QQKGRKSQGTSTMTNLLQDLRYGMRMMVKSPSFALIAVLTLALGIGANTAIFSVVHAVLLQPLPYQKADELVWIIVGSDKDSSDSGFPFSPAGYLYLKNHNNAFSDVAVLSNKGWAANLTDGGDPERLQGFQVSGNLFSLLGVNPEIGRSFAPEEDRP